MEIDKMLLVEPANELNCDRRIIISKYNNYRIEVTRDTIDRICDYCMDIVPMIRLRDPYVKTVYLGVDENTSKYIYLEMMCNNNNIIIDIISTDKIIDITDTDIYNFNTSRYYLTIHELIDLKISLYNSIKRVVVPFNK